MKSIHDMLKKYSNVKMDMTTYIITSEYYEENKGIDVFIDYVQKFVNHMHDTEVLAVVIWYYNGDDIPILQFIVLNVENKNTKPTFEFRVSYHFESDTFYCSKSEFRTYQVRQRWKSFAEGILGLEAIIN